MIEAGVVLIGLTPVYWHLPPDRTASSIPDSRALWRVLWGFRDRHGLGFAHSHPGSGCPSPSMEDLTTFAAVESGLGVRMYWPIISSDEIIESHWSGPGRLEYRTKAINYWPVWAQKLRELSEKEEVEKW